VAKPSSPMTASPRCSPRISVHLVEQKLVAEDSFLQEVESPGLGDSLFAALYSQFTADVQDVLLDRVHADYQVLGDLAVGCAIYQQAQHLTLTDRQCIQERTGAAGCTIKSRCGRLTRCRQQGRDVACWDDLVLVGLTQ